MAGESQQVPGIVHELVYRGVGARYRRWPLMEADRVEREQRGHDGERHPQRQRAQPVELDRLLALRASCGAVTCPPEFALARGR